ncbi:hypothetical protein [Streptomyces alboflavus]|uniref:hypothetical protein n=1 Tax=Streptomyces alboflavus TaxID=67267 RepID=UPI003687CF77
MGSTADSGWGPDSGRGPGGRPGAGGEAPGGDDEGPGGGDHGPGGGDHVPGGGDHVPGGGDEAPGEGPRYPEYRAEPGAPGLGVSGLGLVGITAGLAQLARSGAPLWVLLGLPALLVVLYALMRVAFRRSATLTGPEGVEALGPFGGRFVAWRDVQAIEVEGNPTATVDAGVVREFVYLYDHQGHRILLPHLNSRNLFAFHEDVRELRDLWELRRGADWRARPEAAARIARARRSADRSTAWLRGVAAGLAAMVVTAVAFFALLLGGALDDLDGPAAALLSPVMIMVVPGVVCAAVVAVAEVVRRRGGRGANIP